MLPVFVLLIAGAVAFDESAFANVDKYVFDWSGTISDDVSAVYEACTRLAVAYGFDIEPYEDWIQLESATPEDDLARMQASSCSEAIRTATPESYRREFTKVLLAVHEELPDMRPCPLTRASLALKLFDVIRPGLLLFVLSGAPQAELVREIADYGLYGVFDERVLGDCRDEAAGLTYLANLLDINASAIAYVGDTTSDVEAAHRAGAIAVAVSSGYHTPAKLRSANPDVLYSDILEYAVAVAHAKQQQRGS